MKKVQVGIELGESNICACCKIKDQLKLIAFEDESVLPLALYIEKQANGSLSYTSADVVTKLLEEVHSKVRTLFDLEEEDIVQAVIAVPTYFAKNQLVEMKCIGERTGLEVLRIITEPIAIVNSLAEYIRGNIVIINLEEKVFNISVLTNKKYIALDTRNEERLRGSDFDNRLINHFLSTIEDDLSIDLSSLKASHLDDENYYAMMSKIKDVAIETREKLIDSEEYDIDIPVLFEYGKDHKKYNFSISMTQNDFYGLCEDLIDKAVEVIGEIIKDNYKIEEIKQIFLIGDYCYIPSIQKRIRDSFNIPIYIEESYEAITIGAEKIAHNLIKEENNELREENNKLKQLVIEYETKLREREKEIELRKREDELILREREEEIELRKQKDEFILKEQERMICKLKYKQDKLIAENKEKDQRICWYKAYASALDQKIIHYFEGQKEELESHYYNYLNNSSQWENHRKHFPNFKKERKELL